MRKINAIIASLAIAGLGQIVNQESIAAPICEEGVCEVEFLNTDSAQSFQVPPGVTEIEFELYGAEGGGASGGKGGFVSGVLSDFPETITVMVGGAGIRGDRVPGGFNGGGVSGGGVGPPGSGGGASDLRFGSALSDRVVVAGGGGGQGGPFGGYGGDGGGTVADAGIPGQGDAGGGGTQSAGGVGGETNSSGGSDGQPGQLGLGGDGGYDQRGFGGGAGGGGYYGGGGGGADTDICCMDAGGGGGGSSYADANHTSSVTYSKGTQEGDGLVILRFQKPAEVTEFSYRQLSSDSVSVTLAFDSEVQSVDLSAFEITGCASSELGSQGSTYSLILSDCMADAVVDIEARTMGENQHLPLSNLSLAIALDQVAPDFQLTAPEATNQSSFDLLLETDETGVFDFQNITVTGCEFSTTEEQNLAVLSLSECVEGEVSVTLPKALVTDEFGNQSLGEPMEVLIQIDLTEPSIEFQETHIEQLEEPVQEMMSVTPVVFSETPATFEQFNFEGSQECRIYSEQNESGMSLITKGCSSGEVSWTLPAESLADPVGNLGPVSSATTRFTIPQLIIEEAQPEESPDPTPEPAPAPDPEPSPEPAPEVEPNPEPESESEPSPEPRPNPEPAPAEDRDQGSAVIENPSGPDVDQGIEPEPISDPETDSQPEDDAGSEITSETEIEPEATISAEEDTNTQVESIQQSDDEQSPLGERDEVGSEPTGDVQQNLNPPAIEYRDLPEAVFTGSQEINQAATTSDQETVNVWAIVIAALVVLALLLAVIVLTKNNRSRAID